MQSAEILPFSSDIANELNEMVLSQGMLDLRSFGYGHRYLAGMKRNRLELCLKSFGLVSYYYGREAGLELREDVETVIEPGMVGSKFLLLCIDLIILDCRWFLWNRW